jgi:hypothetical protein
LDLDVMAEHFREKRWRNLIESSAGYSVTVLGRTGMRYVEGGRSIRIDSEVLAKPGPGAIAMFKDSIVAWEPPDESDELTAADRDRIAGNIKRHSKRAGMSFRFRMTGIGDDAFPRGRPP